MTHFKHHRSCNKNYIVESSYEQTIQYYNDELTRCVDRVAKAQWLRMRGDAYAALGYDQYAMQDYDEAIANNAYAYEAFYGRAKLWVKQQKNLAAVEDLNSAIDIGLKNGGNPMVLTNYFSERGAALFYLEYYSLATQDLKCVLNFDPNNAYAHYYLALIAEVQKNYPEQLKEINEVFRCTQTLYPCDYFGRARAYLNNNLFFEAAQDFYRVLQTEQNTLDGAVSAYRLGRMHDRGQGVIKSQDNAAQYYAIAYNYFINHQDNPWASYQLAKMYQYGYGTVQDHARAYEMFNKIVQDKPNAGLCKYAQKHVNQLQDYFVNHPVFRPGLNLPAPKQTGYYSSQNPSLLYSNPSCSENKANHIAPPSLMRRML